MSSQKDLISSGIIESYVLGMASDEDIKFIENAAKSDIEIQKLISENQLALEKYASVFNNPISEKITQKIISVVPDKKENVIAFNPSKIEYMWLKLAASLLFFISVGMVLLYMNTNNKLSKTLAKLDESVRLNQKIASENTSYQSKNLELNNKLSVLSSAGNKTIELKGLEISPSSSALVSFNQSTKEVYISSLNLPMAPKGKQYQFWAIVDGVPVDGGLLSLETNGDSLLKMKNFENPQAFAISLENEGGVQVPTMEAIFVMGSL